MRYHIQTVPLTGKFIVRKECLQICIRIGQYFPNPVNQTGIRVGILALQNQSDLQTGVLQTDSTG